MNFLAYLSYSVVVRAGSGLLGSGSCSLVGFGSSSLHVGSSLVLDSLITHFLLLFLNLLDTVQAIFNTAQGYI